MFVCTTVLYEYMKSLRNDVNNLFDNTHVLLKINPEFYHSIIYIANDGCHVRIESKSFTIRDCTLTLSYPVETTKYPN